MTDIGRSSQTNSTERESAVYSTSGPAFISGVTGSRKEEEAREAEPNIDRKQAVTMTTEKPMKRVGKRGRKPSRIDTKAKLERSRQSARECRARKKLRYQYVEELVSSRDKSIQVLRDELEMYKQHCKQLDAGEIPPQIATLVEERRPKTEESLAPSASHL